MGDINRKFVYLNCLTFGGTVFQTQVLDWIHLYNQKGISFELIQIFRLRKIFKPGYISKQLAGIRKETKQFRGFIFLFPGRGLLSIVNAIIILLKILCYLSKGNEVLIFSRDLIGKEIFFLKKIVRGRIIFFFDARAATAEEKKYVAAKQNNFSRQKFAKIAYVSYLEYLTILNAERIFSVSQRLTNYLASMYNIREEKFVSYPCLSDSGKFYFDLSLRNNIRQKLGVSEDTLIFVYSGGIENEWHISEQMFAFFIALNKSINNTLFLLLTNDKEGVVRAVVRHPSLKEKLLSFSVSNNEVVKYLNAADFGILFRHDTLMNNVSSPTKFAEYMLCGLPVIISEGVGDYSNYTSQKGIGFVIKEEDLSNAYNLNFSTFLNTRFDRIRIAQLGIQHFSKESIINDLVKQFTAFF